MLSTSIFKNTILSYRVNKQNKVNKKNKILFWEEAAQVLDSSIYEDEFLKTCVDEYLSDGYIVKDLKFNYGFSVVDDNEKPSSITYVYKCSANDFETFINSKRELWDNIGEYQWINTDVDGRFGSIDYDPEYEVLIYFSEL
ncbi:MAG: hypothetical protein IKS48_11890 [Eubacterium sp.]|nr:hypothetical protein [Eubacterium sp.]